MSEWTKCPVCGRPEIDFCTCGREAKKMDKDCNCEGECLATRECTYCEGVADLLWFDDNGQKYVCVGCVKDGEIDSEGEQ